MPTVALFAGAALLLLVCVTPPAAGYRMIPYNRYEHAHYYHRARWNSEVVTEPAPESTAPPQPTPPPRPRPTIRPKPPRRQGLMFVGMAYPMMKGAGSGTSGWGNGGRRLAWKIERMLGRNRFTGRSSHGPYK